MEGKTPVDGVVCVREGAVAIVKFDRESKRNTLDNNFVESLQETLLSLRDAPEVRVVILTGSGREAFSAGADLEALATLGKDEALAFTRRVLETATLVEDLGKPVIAAINGEAIGAGCELALACHLRLASGNSTFATSEVGVGVRPVFGYSSRLVSLIGRSRALELMLTGARLSAEEAERLGIVNRIVEPDELLQATTVLAHKVALGAPLAMRSALEAISRGMALNFDEALRLEGKLFSECFATRDMREGVLAFLEKRQPDFKGD